MLDGPRSAATSPLSYCIIFQLGGAVSRVGEDETAYSHRSLGHNVNINAVWTPHDSAPERHIRWAQDFSSALEPFAPGGVYVNFLGNEGAARTRTAYGDANYERLVALKAAWDPTNFLRSNHNIKPRGRKGK